MPVLDPAALDTMFFKARTYRQWTDRPVPDAMLVQIYEIARLAPSSSNCSPLRVTYVRTPEGKARLIPLLDEGNRIKAATAPVTAILAGDLEFYERMPDLRPDVADARSWYAGQPEHIARTANDNAWLQGGYFIMAARALGLDCGPMGGFDAAGVNAEFFAGTPWRATFVVNLGYGDATRLRPRDPRLSVEDACRFV